MAKVAWLEGGQCAIAFCRVAFLADSPKSGHASRVVLAGGRILPPIGCTK